MLAILNVNTQRIKYNMFSIVNVLTYLVGYVVFGKSSSSFQVWFVFFCGVVAIEESRQSLNPFDVAVSTLESVFHVL